MFLGEKKREKKNWAPATKRCAHVVHAWCMHMDLGDIFEHKLKNMSSN